MGQWGSVGQWGSGAVGQCGAVGQWERKAEQARERRHPCLQTLREQRNGWLICAKHDGLQPFTKRLATDDTERTDQRRGFEYAFNIMNEHVRG